MELPAHWRDWDVGLEVPDDVSAADWLHTALRPWAQDGTVVANFVPASHEAFARVLHPAGDGKGRDVRWADLARPRGVQVGPETGFCEASGQPICQPATTTCSRARSGRTQRPFRTWFVATEIDGFSSCPAYRGCERLR
jgi:hypothetical protein